MNKVWKKIMVGVVSVWFLSFGVVSWVYAAGTDFKDVTITGMVDSLTCTYIMDKGILSVEFFSGNAMMGTLETIVNVGSGGVAGLWPIACDGHMKIILGELFDANLAASNNGTVRNIKDGSGNVVKMGLTVGSATANQPSGEVTKIECHYKQRKNLKIEVFFDNGASNVMEHDGLTLNEDGCRNKLNAIIVDLRTSGFIGSDKTANFVSMDGGVLVTHKTDTSANSNSNSNPNGANNTPGAGMGECERTILTWIPCDEQGIWDLLGLVLNIMTAGVGVLATIGLIISGIQWMTARDKEDQIVKSKSRIFNIVIGMVVWALMWLVLTWLMPGGIQL